MSKSVAEGYNYAKEIYSGIGVDIDAAIRAMDSVTLSVHCWQGDDVGGFENSGEALSGGIQATGNYPGKARTPAELRADLKKAMSFIPGDKNVALHAMYLESDKKTDRDEIEPEHFSAWADWAVSEKIGLDFNSTFFSHPKSSDGYTVSNANPEIRKFWIEHAKRSRLVGEYFGRRTGKRCITNLWLPDGCKDTPIDRYAPRERLLSALDEIFAQKLNPAYHADAVESKLFGIGSESYVVGSHEFYMGYSVSRKNSMPTLDVGHFHPSETVSNKISSMLLYVEELLLHVSRPVRWDSDHVVTLDDELCAIMCEIVRGGFLKRVNLSLDYFDASINRVAAWVIGSRNAQKALLRAMLEPVEMLKGLESKGDFTAVLALTEELKFYPFAAVWDYYCEKSGVPVRGEWLDEVRAYEKKILAER